MKNPLANFKSSFMLILILLSSAALCQQKQIELTNFYQRTVPEGKIWYISNTKEHRMILSDRNCDDLWHSNPARVIGILCYDTVTTNSNNPTILGFTIKNQPIWLHDDIYSVKPYFLIKNYFEGDAASLQNLLSYTRTWKFKPDEMVFYPGMRLRTTGCANNIMIYERDMNLNDKANLTIAKNKQIIAAQALNDQRLAREQAERKVAHANYNNKSYIYSIKEISNAPAIFKSVCFDTVCIKFANAIRAKLNGDYKSYHQFVEQIEPVKIPVYVKWDSTGKVLSYKINSENTTNDIKLDSLLKLPISPLAKYNSSRRCLFEADLMFTVKFEEKFDGTYYIKKLKKGYKFIDNKYPEMEREVTTKLQPMSLLDNKFYRIDYTNIYLTVNFYPYNYDEIDPGEGEKYEKLVEGCVEVHEIERQYLPHNRF